MILITPSCLFNSRPSSAVALSKFKTKYFADSVEWCPGTNLIACGNYQLEDKKEEGQKPSRRGCIYLIEALPDDSLKVHHQIETRGILDQKWFDGSHLGVVTSIGELAVYQLDVGKKKLEEQSKVCLDESEETIALSLDHFGGRTLVSDSQGNISLFSDSLEIVDTFSGHAFEAWTCAFDRQDGNVFYSGGDDSVLNAFDMRMGSQPSMKNSKTHSAGVTSLATGLPNENQFLTGSYDQNLRLFDKRAFSRPIHELDLHGGIWRIKMNPVDPNFILCACMYENFSIVRFDEKSGFSLNAVLYPDDAKAICYGADWAQDSEGPATNKFATCSFYDNLFSLNSFKRTSGE